MVRRPELQATCRKVKLEIIPGRGDVESSIEIRLKDGPRFSTYINIARGNPGNELSEKELAGKFLMLVEPLSGKKMANNLKSLILNCQEIENAQEIGNLIRKASLKALHV